MARLTLALHDDAVADLRSVRQTDPRAAARILAILEQVKADPALLEALTDHGFGKDGSRPFDVQKWVEVWNQQRDLWRLKIWDLERRGIQYRIIYAYRWRELRYYVLAIVERRNFDYDPSSAIGRRILAAYEQL